MTASDIFAPGHPAIVKIGDQEHTALRDSNGAWLIGDIEDLRVVYDIDELVTAVRPLYVLDVANQRKVKALHTALAENGSVVDAVTSLLTRPAEPQLTGAIVRCSDGTVRIRTDEEPTQPWLKAASEDYPRCLDPWSAFHALEVLFIGVPA